MKLENVPKAIHFGRRKKNQFSSSAHHRHRHYHHHHHLFNVPVPLRVGCTAPMFVLSFFSIQFCLQNLHLLASSFCDHHLSYLSMSSLIYVVHGIHQLLVLLVVFQTHITYPPNNSMIITFQF